jgi:hypothetical protein
MPKRATSGEPPYEVGYGRPPKATQFAPGKSGNPKGRPKGSKTLGKILQEIGEEKITVTENGKVRRLSANEVFIRNVRNAAVRNDLRAAKFYAWLLDRYSGSAETAINHAELLAEDQEILNAYLPKPNDPKAAPNSELHDDGGDDVDA